MMLLVLLSIAWGDTISRPICGDFFNFKPNALSVLEKLNAAKVAYREADHFVVVLPTEGSELNRLASWIKATFNQHLILLTHKTHSSETQHLEEPGNMVIYQPELLLLMSTKLNMAALQELIWSDFQTRRGQAR
jgi:hypothetical protein